MPTPRKKKSKYRACVTRAKKNRELIERNVDRLIDVVLLMFTKMTRDELMSPKRNLEAAAARSLVYAALYHGVLNRKGMPDIAEYFNFSKVTVWNGIQRAKESAESNTIDWYGRRLRIMANATQIAIEKFKD